MPTLSEARTDGLGSTEPNPTPKPPSNAHELRNSGSPALRIRSGAARTSPRAARSGETWLHASLPSSLCGRPPHAAALDRSHPGTAASLREGLEEKFTLQRPAIRGSLKTTLASTNPCESMIECVRRTSRNVKRWQSGEMALRWTAAGMLEADLAAAVGVMDRAGCFAFRRAARSPCRAR